MELALYGCKRLMPRAIAVEKGRPALAGELGFGTVGLEAPLPPEGKSASEAREAARAKGGASSLPPGPPVPGLPFKPDLPDFAKKANDLEAIKKAVEDAAAVSGALWFSYLFALFYFAVAAGAVTHEDLFFERAVKLPFLGIDLPLLAFFFLAPILFVMGHAYTLVHLVMLTDKARRYDESLDDQIKESGDLSMDEVARRRDIHAGLRQQLPSNIFVQFLAGPKELRESRFGWALRAIAWITLVIAPVLLVLLMQVQFLPFHSSFIIWTHRLALLADITFLWWLWTKILSGREAERRNPIAALNVFEIGVLLSASALMFSWIVVTFPGEVQESFLAKWDRPKWIITPHDWLFSGSIDRTTRRRTSFFSSTLVLPGLNIYEGLGIEDPEKARWHDFVFRARGRDLKGAIFDLANLPKVDFTGADLRYASLVQAQLPDASLAEARLRGAFLIAAQLTGVNLRRARFEGARLDDVDLRGQNLSQAHFEGAALDRAHLQGALLNGASFQGASLDHTELQGAYLEAAQLQGASLNSAQLQGAMLDGANLLGARLEYADFRGASLRDAQLQGSSLEIAKLEATDLSDAALWRTNRWSPPDIPPPRTVKLSDAASTWLPIFAEEGNLKPWSPAAYENFRLMMETLPSWVYRPYEAAVLRDLDCANSKPEFASCDPSKPPPSEAAAWQQLLESANVDEPAYAKALAAVLRTLICSGQDSSIYILRGAMRGVFVGPDAVPHGRLVATGAEAPGLIDFIVSKACPVSNFLVEGDRAMLLRIRHQVEESVK